MTEFLLKLMGVKVGEAQQVASVSLALRHREWLGWMVLLALALGVLAWGVYRWVGAHRDLAQRRRRSLTTLRIVFVTLVLFMLLRPVFSFTIEGRVRRVLVTLLDASASMNLPDPRLEAEDLARAGIARGWLKRLDQPLEEARAAQVRKTPRAEILDAALANPALDVLPQLKAKYDLAVFAFGAQAAEISEQDIPQRAAKIDGHATGVGDAVREILSRQRGQPVAGIFLATDGGSNTGSEPLEAARLAAREGIPLYIYGVGITSPRDILVQSVFTQDIAFLKDELPVTVRVRGQGMKGQKARLSLKLGETEVASKEVEFSGENEQAVALAFTPQKAGEFALSATIDPRDDETAKDNNSASQRLRVIDDKIKVLFVEQAPRWEFRHVQSVLLRDRRIAAKFLLLEADPALAGGADSPYLAKFPATREELFKFDLIMLGDVNPAALTPEQLGNLHEFVAKFGGACALIAGRNFNPTAYQDTPIGKMLPVEIVAQGAEARGRSTASLLALTPLGRSSPLLKLSAREEDNAEIWRRFPPVHWVQRVGRAKPAAQVLLEDTDPAKATRFGRMPAMVLQQYGLGQVLYIGTDDTWRWRQEANVVHYPALWGQIVQRMALARLLGGSKRTQLSVDKQSYTTGERVKVFARLYDANFTPLAEAAVNGTATVQGPPGQPPVKTEVPLRAVPDQPGMFRGEFVAAAPGACRFSLASDAEAGVDFAIAEARFEIGDTAMNEPLLKEMARLSGGAFFREENLADLPGALKAKDERIQSVIDADLWSSPFYFALLCGVIVTEWALRKRFGLK